jgi:large-conductance mechanosensitive channel
MSFTFGNFLVAITDFIIVEMEVVNLIKSVDFGELNKKLTKSWLDQADKCAVFPS